MNGFGFKSLVLWASAISLVCAWGCDYGRMKDQESLRPYKIPLPEMPAGTLPAEGGLQLLRSTRAEDLKLPAPQTPETIEQGETYYEYFCMMCHGPNHDGRGTVGQSFSPLPANLKSPYIQKQGDGALFKKISLGFRRHPPMAYTISEEDRWALVHFIRTLATKP
jgi:cytochrome c5